MRIGDLDGFGEERFIILWEFGRIGNKIKIDKKLIQVSYQGDLSLILNESTQKGI